MSTLSSKCKFLRPLFLGILLVAFCGDLFANKRQPSVACITPTDSRFWREFRSFSSAVAEDLDINFTQYPEISAFSALKLVRQIAQSNEKPDYLIFRYLANTSHDMLKEAEAAGIRTIIVNNSVPVQEQETVGLPRQKLKHWIGLITPDEWQAGYDLADSIIDAKKKQLSNDDSLEQKLEFIALAGDGLSHVSVARVAGLRERVAEDPEVKIKRVIDTHWSGQQAAIATPKLLNFYPDVSMIWGIGDHILIEGYKGGLPALGNRIRNLSMGSIDATPFGIQHVIDGKISVTLGGHFSEGGWALILAHDHFHGYDFQHDLGTEISLPMLAITKENAELYLKMFDDKLWQKIDFKEYSKRYNRELKHYNFSLANLLERIAQINSEAE